MKAALIVLGILAFQLLLGIFMGKLIHAGSHPPGRNQRRWNPNLESRGLQVVTSRGRVPGWSVRQHQ
jgi:hypothetical protein